MAIVDGICSNCGILIDDPYYLMIVDRCWHLSCLKCSDCRRFLGEEKTCFIKHGEILCKNDYLKRSCVCNRCERIIEHDEIILRAEDLIYHLECFTCVQCQINLHPGDEYGLKDNLIYCREHFLQQLDDSGYQTSPNDRRESNNFLTISPKFFSSSFVIERENDRWHNGRKQKRLRTSFKHQQLRYLRSYFNLNHNPDAKDLKNLSEKTNLSKRVLQVWFQNARAKHRRNSTVSPL